MRAAAESRWHAALRNGTRSERRRALDELIKLDELWHQLNKKTVLR
jgi:hypothetical protein